MKAIVPKTPRYGLPKTGQTYAYAADDDGALQKGYPLTGERFTDNGNNTLTDNATGLMWIKSGRAIGTVGAYNWIASAYSVTEWNWSTALLAIAALNANNYQGHNDWRMPNIIEMQSLINFGSYPGKDGSISSPFSWSPVNYPWMCWTSTTAARAYTPTAYVIMTGTTGSGERGGLLGFTSEVTIYREDRGGSWTYYTTSPYSPGAKVAHKHLAIPCRGPD
ncbi:MAG: DUF1566 domain-containing protein [Candidatus Omnitrophica bacterium]|nr:DUF1566 domain-containing protein [Candidatus Omnitrophota bacterium]